MGFRINRGIFQKLEADGRTYTNTFKIDTDGRIKEVDADGNVVEGYLKTGEKAADSNLLDGIDSSNFLRSNTSDSMFGSLTIYSGSQNNHGFEISSSVATYRSDAPYWRLWQPSSQEQIAAVNGGEVRLSYNGTHKLKTRSDGIEVLGDAYINKVIDRNNNNYYVDPDSNSHLNTVYAFRYYDKDNSSYYAEPASISHFNDLRANIIYDRNNTGYYLDLNNTSKANYFDANYFRDRNNTSYYLQPSSTNRLYRIDANEYNQVGHGNPRNNLGSPTVTEMALFNEQFNNKTAFHDPAKVTYWVQWTDGGPWEDLTRTSGYDENDTRRFIAGYDSSDTITIPNGCFAFRIEVVAKGYTFANAVYIYWSSQSHNTRLHVWKKRCDNNQWYAHAQSDSTVSSWPGHLYLPMNGIAWHETSTTSSGHYNTIRLEFLPNWQTSNATYADRDIHLYKLQIWGGYPAGSRYPYSVNEHGDIMFRSTVYANNTWSSNKILTTRDWITWSNLGGKPSTFTPSSHQHAWSEITSKPTTFTPSSHTHGWEDITGKPSTFTPSSHTHNYILNTTNYVASGAMQSWDRQESTPDLNPTTDWFTALRIGHGHPVDYYSNTLAIQMTGSDLGRIYTRTISNGSKGTWRKYWHGGDFSSSNISNWNTAYGWGNHATQGYITTIPEEYLTQTEGDARYSLSSHNHNSSYDALGASQAVRDDFGPRIDAVETATARNATDLATKANAGGSYNQDFYVDDLYYDAWIRNHTGTNGLYWSASGWHLYVASNYQFRFRSGNSSKSAILFNTNGTDRNSIYNNSSNEIGFLSTSGSWIFKVQNGGDINLYGSVIASNGVEVINRSGQWVGDSTGLVGPQGPAGPAGANGADGADGVATATVDDGASTTITNINFDTRGRVATVSLANGQRFDLLMA